MADLPKSFAAAPCLDPQHYEVIFTRAFPHFGSSALHLHAWHHNGSPWWSVSDQVQLFAGNPGAAPKSSRNPTCYSTKRRHAVSRTADIDAERWNFLTVAVSLAAAQHCCTYMRVVQRKHRTHRFLGRVASELGSVVGNATAAEPHAYGDAQASASALLSALLARALPWASSAAAVRSWNPWSRPS